MQHFQRASGQGFDPVRLFLLYTLNVVFVKQKKKKLPRLSREQEKMYHKEQGDS